MQREDGQEARSEAAVAAVEPTGEAIEGSRGPSEPMAVDDLSGFGVPPGPLPQPPPRQPRRIRRSILIGGAIIVAIAVGGTLFVLLPEDSEAPKATDAIPGVPTGLVAEEDPFKVQLSWDAPPEGSPVQSYEISRDDEHLETVEAPSTVFVDDTVLPDQDYTYVVRALAGDATSEDASIEVQTPTAPPGTARLDGVFNVKMRTTSQTGYGDWPSKATLGWKLRSTCKEGVCPAEWKDIHTPSLQLTLKLRGGVYIGEGKGLLYVECGGARATSSVTIRLRPVEAEVLGEDEWRVTKLAGTFVQQEAVQLGCGTSMARHDVVLTLASV